MATSSNFPNKVPTNIQPKGSAIRRLAQRIEKSTNYDDIRFRELNKKRIEDFTYKPYRESEDSSTKKNQRRVTTSVPGICDYRDYTEITGTTRSVIPLDAPECQSVLGHRSRFGDGDGSFWDRWMNSESTASERMFTLKGLISISENMEPTVGFKRYYKAKKADDKKDFVVKPYSERRKERLAEENTMKFQGTPISQPLKSNDSNNETGLDWNDLPDVETPFKMASNVSPPGSASSLPQVTPSDDDAYFGSRARHEFFDEYKQLYRHRNVLVTPSNSDSRSSTLPQSRSDDSLPSSRAATSMSNSMGSRRGNITSKEMTSRPPDGLNQDGQQSGTVDNNMRNSKKLSITDKMTKVNWDEKSISRREAERCRVRQYGEVLEKRHLLSPEVAAKSRPRSVQSDDSGHGFPPRSPRARFIEGCVVEDVGPKPSVLIRQDVSSTLDLNGQRIGDKVASILSKSLEGLPLLAHLNLTDNKLTVVSITALVSHMSACSRLVTLNLSRNRMDMKSIRALNEYLCLGSCSLTELILRKVSLDDKSCTALIQTLMTNASSKILVLDMGENSIGSGEFQKAILPDFVSGAVTLAQYLSMQSCQLEKLLVDWNTIRGESALALVRSLKLNTRLKDFNISYNSIGVINGEILADTLHFHPELINLSVAQNCLGPRACVMFVTAIKCSKTIRYVDLSGNTIGEDGSKALLSLASIVGDRVEVNVKECITRMKDPTVRFNNITDSPQGNYKLDLSQPYERSVFIEITLLLASRYDLKLSVCKYCADPVKDSRSTQELNLVMKTKTKEKDLTPQQNQPEVATIEEIATDIDTAKKIFHQFDVDGSGFLDKDELSALLKHLGILQKEQTVGQLLALYDSDGSGVIEEGEFVGFLEQVRKSVDMTKNRSSEIRYIALSSSSEPYRVPDVGTIEFDLTVDDSAAIFDNISASSVESLVATAKSTHSTTIIDHALTTRKFHANEALALLPIMLKEFKDIVKVLLKVIPRMVSPIETRLLVSSVVTNPEDKIILKTALDPLYNPLLGVVNGFYQLDLSIPFHADCLQLLLTHNDEVVKVRQKTLGDISQYSNWSCFRNVVIDGNVVYKADVIRNLKSPSNISFDFVTMATAGISSTPISDFRFLNILIGLGLVPDNEADKAATYARVSKLDSDAKETAHGIGLKDFCLNLRPSELAAKHRLLFYQNLNIRSTVDQLEVMLLQATEGATAQSSTSPTRTKNLLHIPVKLISAFKNNWKNEYKGPALDALEASYTLESFMGVVIATSQHISLSALSRAKRTVDAIYDTLGGRYVTSAQLAVLLEKLPGGGWALSPWSTLRVELVVSFFSNLVDPINFEVVLKALSGMEIGMVQCRLGFLSIYNPLKPEGYTYLDLSRKEERQWFRVLVLLASIEPGQNWLDTGCWRSMNDITTTSTWQMPPSWLSESGIPDRAIVRVRYYSGEGAKFGECCPDITTRLALMALVYSEPYPHDIRFTYKPTLERADATMEDAGLQLSFIGSKQKLLPNPIYD